MFTNAIQIKQIGKFIKMPLLSIYHLLSIYLLIFSTIVTLLVSAIWHGIYSGYYFCILGVPFYLPIEDLYHKLLRKDSKAGPIQTLIINVLFWISKFFAFSYMGIAFLLLTIDKIWFFYRYVIMVLHLIHNNNFFL